MVLLEEELQLPALVFELDELLARGTNVQFSGVNSKAPGTRVAISATEVLVSWLNLCAATTARAWYSAQVAFLVMLNTLWLLPMLEMLSRSSSALFNSHRRGGSSIWHLFSQVND